MDVLLLTATASLSTYLPRHSFALIRLQSSRAVTTLSLGLSLTLFSLSLLEAAPRSWLLWLDNTTNNTTETQQEQQSGKYYLSITGAYRWVLWGMVVLCIVILPSATGTQLMLARREAADRATEPEDLKRRSFTQSQQRHWIVRFIYRIVSLVCSFVWTIVRKILNFVLLAPIGRCFRYVKQRLQYSYLPLTNGDGESFQILRTPILLFLRDPVYRKSIIFGSLFGTIFTVVFLMVITPLVVESTPGLRILSLSDAVSWLCAVGILLSALMNGFGSVSMPYTCLAGLFLDPVHPDAIANAEIELEKTRVTLDDKQKEMSSIGLTLPAANPSSNRRSLWRRVVRRRFSDLGDEVSQRKKLLATEIEFLETLVNELTADVDEMRHSQTVAFKARTPAGKVKSWMGIGFSIVLLARLFAAMSSVWIQHASGTTKYRSAGVDPVTRILSWLWGHHIVEQEDLHTLSQFISLLISAVLSFSQLRNFIRTATTVIRRTSSIYRKCYCNTICGRLAPRGRSPDLEGDARSVVGEERYFSHLVAALLCCYCLACIVLTKMMLPYEHRAGFSSALGMAGSEPNEFFFKIRTFAVNVAFSLSALISAAVLAVILGIMRSNARRYAAMKTTSSPIKKPVSTDTASLSKAEP